jgi:hypothetical protein
MNCLSLKKNCLSSSLNKSCCSTTMKMRTTRTRTTRKMKTTACNNTNVTDLKGFFPSTHANIQNYYIIQIVSILTIFQQRATRDVAKSTINIT